MVAGMKHAPGYVDPKEIDKKIGESILVRRDRLGWSRKELADKITDAGVKMNPQVVYNLETGERSLKMSEARTVAEVLGVVIEDLLPGRAKDVINRNYVRAVDAGEEFFHAAEKLTAALERVENDVRNSVHARENFFGFAEDSEESARIRLAEGSPIAIAERALLLWVTEEYEMGDLDELYDPTRTAAEILSQVVAEKVSADPSLTERWWHKDLQRLHSFREAARDRTGMSDDGPAS